MEDAVFYFPGKKETLSDLLPQHPKRWKSSLPEKAQSAPVWSKKVTEHEIWRPDLMLCDMFCGFVERGQSAQHFAGLKRLPWIKNKTSFKSTSLAPDIQKLNYFKNSFLSYKNTLSFCFKVLVYTKKSFVFFFKGVVFLKECPGFQSRKKL